MNDAGGVAGLPPLDSYRARLAALASRLARGGEGAADDFQTALAAWGEAHDRWRDELLRALALHHEIANALVGVRGHAQLLARSPAAAVPEVRERLEVILRESARIQEAAARLGAVKTALAEVDRGPAPGAARAA